MYAKNQYYQSDRDHTHKGVVLLALPKQSSIESFCSKVALRDELTAEIICDQYGDYSESCQTAQQGVMGSYNSCLDRYYSRML